MSRLPYPIYVAIGGGLKPRWKRLLKFEHLPTFWGNMKPRRLDEGDTIRTYPSVFSVDLTTYLSIRLSIFFDPQGWNIYAKNNPMTDIDILYITNTCPLCSVYVIITSITPYNFEMTPRWNNRGELSRNSAFRRFDPKRSFNCSKILREPRKTIDQLSELRKHWKHKSTCLEDHPN